MGLTELSRNEFSVQQQTALKPDPANEQRVLFEEEHPPP
jgi:hypothetical protein